MTQPLPPLPCPLCSSAPLSPTNWLPVRFNGEYTAYVSEVLPRPRVTIGGKNVKLQAVPLVIVQPWNR